MNHTVCNIFSRDSLFQRDILGFIYVGTCISSFLLLAAEKYSIINFASINSIFVVYLKTILSINMILKFSQEMKQ